MAEPISKRVLKKMQVVPYEQIREGLKTGGIFLAAEVMLFQVLYNALQIAPGAMWLLCTRMKTWEGF